MNKVYSWIIGIVAVLGAIWFVSSGMRPEFFDIFGLFTFTFLLIVGWLMLKGKEINYWIKFLIFLVGILGVMVDGYIVYITYLR